MAFMMKGSELHISDKKYVLAAYVHRYTKDHKPEWANGVRKNSRGAEVSYMPQFASDREWLENTYFTVRKDGHLDRRYRQCESHPTWPDGIEP